MRKLVSMTFVLLLCILQVFAQEKTVTGKVTDEKDGSPLSGVSVTVKGTTVGTTTGADGSYRLSVPSNARTLVFSFVNFEPIEMAIGSKTSFNVKLSSVEKSLQEVVVTGYSREKKGQFAGAATTLSAAKTVDMVPVGAFDQALQGRVPGMFVNSGSGQPGASANVQIRGVSSISSAFSQPLYIVDGIPMPASDMATINPNDFESLTVLKDGAASALYGSRGGRGVIVITTKRGKAGQANFTFRSQVGFTQAPQPNRFDMMNSAEILQYEEQMGLIVGNAVASPGWLYSSKNPSYAAASPAEQARRDFLLDSFRNNNVDMYKLLFRQGVSQNHEINVNGGNSVTRYFLSLGTFNQDGVDLKSNLKRYTARFNMDNTMGKLSITWNSLLGFSRTSWNEGSWYGNSTRNPFQMVWRAKPYENPYRPDGSIIFGASTASVPRVIGNLLEGMEHTQWQERQLKINSGVTMAYKILPVLTFKNVTGIDNAIDWSERYVDANSYIGSLQTFQSGVGTEAFRTRTQLINTSSLVFNKKFADKHDVEVGGYFETIRAWQKGFGFNAFLLDPRLFGTTQGSGAIPTGGAATVVQNVGSARSGFGIRSYFATGRYTFDNKYTLTANVRRDGTSRILNPANDEITTFSVGAIWDVIKEGFMDNQNIISDLKVRASYGKVPDINSIPGGSYNISGGGIYTIPNYHAAQQPAFTGTNGFAGSTLTGIVPTVFNDNLRMEYVEKSNIGADVALLKNRLRLTLDFYRNVTRDLFVSQTLPANSGFGGGSLQVNAGSMENKGVEISISGDLIKTKDFDLTLGWNHNINVNEILDLGQVNEYPAGTGIIKVGLPFGTHYAQNYLGADPATGRPTYETADGNTTTDFGQAGLFHKFGTWLPKHLGGFTLDFRYKRLSLSALFSYQFEVYRYNNVENWTTRGTPGYVNAVNANRKLLTEQWQKPGDVKYYQSPAYDRQFTAADIHDAKFLRFRSLNMNYQIPEINAGGTRLIKGARFYIQAQNLFIWSPWRGLDPEDDNNISLQEFPNPRAVVVGIDINF